MTDRRRINGPPGASRPPTFVPSPHPTKEPQRRSRKPNELRKIFLQTGLIPSASGSAYLELEASPQPKSLLLSKSSTIKLSCAIQGPKPLPRNASFSPNLQLSASVKFAPFATRVRQGYVPNSTEKDLGLHLENALKGVILPDRWPKSAIDVTVTILESADQQRVEDGLTSTSIFNLLAAAINVSIAALSDAKIDCLDLLSAGVGAVVLGTDGKPVRLLDPAPAEHEDILSSCVVGYLPSRDEVVEMWSSHSVSGSDGGTKAYDELIDSAVAAARGAQTVLQAVLLESIKQNPNASRKLTTRNELDDIEMKT